MISGLFESFRDRSWKGTLEGFLLGFIFVFLLLSFYPIGLFSLLVNFTYATKGHDPAAKAQMLPFLATWVGGMFLWEAAFRGFLLRTLLRRYVWQKAFWIQLFILNLVVVPALWAKASRLEEMGLFRFFLEENLVECFWALFFLRTGSILSTAVMHGVYNFVRFEVINNVAGPFETFYFYSSASDHFYWLMITMAFLTAVLQLWINQAWGMREQRPGS